MLCCPPPRCLRPSSSGPASRSSACSSGQTRRHGAPLPPTLPQAVQEIDPGLGRPLCVTDAWKVQSNCSFLGPAVQATPLAADADDRLMFLRCCSATQSCVGVQGVCQPGDPGEDLQEGRAHVPHGRLCLPAQQRAGLRPAGQGHAGRRKQGRPVPGAFLPDAPLNACASAVETTVGESQSLWQVHGRLRHRAATVD